MFGNFELFLAWRLLRIARVNSALFLMMRLSILSICVSTGALMLAAAIMRGFEDATLTTLKGLSPELLIHASSQYLNVPAIDTILKSEFSSEIRASTPFSTRYCLIQKPEQTQDISHVTTLSIIEPATYTTVSRMHYTAPCTAHTHQMQQLGPQEILLGVRMAEQLGVTCGDTVLLRYPAEEIDTDQPLLQLEQAQARVVGIVSSGIDEIDAHTAFISYTYAKELFTDGDLVSQLHLAVAPHVALEAVQKKLQKRFPFTILSWYELNPSLMKALHLENLGMTLIFLLIMAITGITTMAVVSLQLLTHEGTIAILQAYGLPLTRIIRLFMLFGVLITCIGTACGALVAGVVAYCIDTYHLIQLPDIYFTTYVPAPLSFTIVLIVTSLALVVSLVATWYPTRRLKNLPIGRILADS